MTRAMHSTLGSSMRRQRGMVAFMVLCIMLTLLGITAAGAAMLISTKSQGSTTARLAYLARARVNVTDWYLANAATVDATSAAPDTATLRSAMGEAPQFGVRVVSTTQLGLPCTQSNSPSCVGYHDIYLWLPPVSHADTTTLNATTGVFTPDAAAQWVKVAGAAVEQSLIEASTTTMGLLQSQLRAFFAARERSDANVNPQTNYFRDSACSGTTTERLPCVNTFTNLTATSIASVMGIDSTNATNAWGNPIQVSNQAYSSVTAPPYSMAIRSATPWGGYLQMAVVQPN